MEKEKEMTTEKGAAAKGPRELLNELQNGLKKFGSDHPKESKAFMNFIGAAANPGALDAKTKELISTAISIFTRCEYCTVSHVYQALKAGASREELEEAAITAMTFGGTSSLAYMVTLLNDSIDEFEKDFS